MSNIIYHNHHIIPKHMGGTDDPSNLIKLTVEEHAGAHKLLWEKDGRWQDEIAWKALSGQISSAEAIITAVKKANTGRKATDELRKHFSITRTGTNNPFYGRKHSPESIKKIRDRKIGKKASTETKQKLSEIRKGVNNSFYGKTHTTEFKEKQRKNRLGKKDSPETIEKKRQAQLRRYSSNNS